MKEPWKASTTAACGCSRLFARYPTHPGSWSRVRILGGVRAAARAFVAACVIYLRHSRWYRWLSVFTIAAAENAALSGTAKDLGSAAGERKKTKRSAENGAIGHWDWDIKTGKVVWSDEVYRSFGSTRRILLLTSIRSWNYRLAETRTRQGIDPQGNGKP